MLRLKEITTPNFLPGDMLRQDPAPLHDMSRYLEFSSIPGEMERERLRKKVRNLWIRKKADLLSEAYNEESMPLWNAFTGMKNNGYYIYTADVEGLESKPVRFYLRCMREIFKGQSRGPTTLISRGVGGEYAVRDKDLLVAKALGVRHYVANDKAPKAAERAAAFMKRQLPEIFTYASEQNYRTEKIDLPEKNGPRVFLEMGSSLGNILPEDMEFENGIPEGFPTPGSPPEMYEPFIPYKEIKTYLSHVRDQMNPGDYYILGMDGNNDKKMVEAAYRHKACAHFIEDLLRKIQKDLELINFRHEDLYFRSQFFPMVAGIDLQVHGYMPIRPGDFLQDNRMIEYELGDFFVIGVSWKMRPPLLNPLIAQCGMRARWFTHPVYKTSVIGMRAV